MPKLKIKTGDKVIVLSGNYKGKIGIIQKIYPKNDKVIVSGINIVKKRIKPNNNNNLSNSNIIEKESPIHISNISILDIKTGKPTKVGILFKEGKKNRILKKSGECLENFTHHKKLSS